MKKIALYIPRPGATSLAIQRGYVDTLRHLGWTVYVCDPKTKIGCRRLIEKYGVNFIMTSSRYGMRQLPIQVINDNGISVIVEALPLNPDDKTVDGPYEFAHKDEADLVREIDKVVVHTRLESHLWSEYMCGWQDDNVDVKHLMSAGNIIGSTPISCSILTDVAMVANFGHRQNIMRQLIKPLFERLDLLGYSYQAFGDNIWGLAGLNCNGPMECDPKTLSQVYSTAKVCPNVHTESQITLQSCVNERSFMIPLCGGLQVSDNPLIAKYLGDHCEVASSTTDFMNKIIGVVENEECLNDRIKAGVEDVSSNHTYFNRLVYLFQELGLLEYAELVDKEGKRVAQRHCWAIDALLNAEERGVLYDKNSVRTA